MKKCIIIDDEPLAHDVIKSLISHVPELTLLGSFQNPVEARYFIERNEVDLLFLDIDMPELNGLDFIRSLNKRPAIIITTAHRGFAADGFDLDVTDFILKPISLDRFLKAVGKFLQKTFTESTDLSSPATEPFIFVKENKAMVKLYLKDIKYIEALKNYVKIVLKGRQVITYSTLSFMEEKLPPAYFVRIHKSYIVNVSQIDKVSPDFVIIDETSLSIGNSYKEKIEAILKKTSL